MFILKLLAIVIIVEFVAMLVWSGKTAPGITWFLSHPFGVGIKLFWGLLIRVGLIILAFLILF